MKVNKYTIEDANKYLGDTIVQFKEESGRENLFYFIKADLKYIYAKNIYTDEPILVDITKEYDVDFHFPRKLVFNSDNFSILITRIPAQMWKKGIHSKNTSFYLLKESGWQYCSFTPDLIKAYVQKQEYFSLESNTKVISCALSPRISFCRGKIYIDMTFVGTYNETTETLTTHPMFLEDLKPYFPYKIYYET